MSPSSAPLLRRGPGEVQVGLDADAVVVQGLSPTEIHTLDQLRERRARPSPGSRLEGILTGLRERGLVVEPGHRRPGAVVLDGDGAVTRRLIPLLREAHVVVHHGSGALDDADRAIRAGTRTVIGTPTLLVVQVTAHALSPLRAWPHTRVPCLPVIVGHRCVSVGPITGTGGPCLRCLDLTRTDLDPAWPGLLAQLGETAEPTEESPLTLLAASLTATAVLDHLRGHTWPDRSLEASLAPPSLQQRRWSAHPRCHRHGGG